MEKFKAKWKDIFSSRGCFGCCTKSLLILDGNEPSNVSKTQGKNPRKSEDLLSNSSSEIDNSSVQPQRENSSAAIQNRGGNSSGNNVEGSNPNEFVNHGLILWNQIRQQWTGTRSSQARKQVGQPKISPKGTFKSLLETNKPFPHPITLQEMVDLLVDVWELEGLFD